MPEPSDLKRYQALLFDLDGTLSDPSEGFIRSLRFAFERHEFSGPSDDVLRGFIGPPLEQSLGHLLNVPADDAAVLDMLDAYRERYQDIGKFENQPYAGIDKVLRRLNDHYPLYVATAKSRVFAEPIIGNFGWRELFKEVYGPGLDGTLGDKTDLIAHILKREKLRPSDVVMIGDRQHDIIAAKRNNVSVFGVTWGFGSHTELEAAGADCIVDTPAQLADLILGPQEPR